jgi:hypothetical protein
MAKDNRSAAQSTGTEFFPADTAQPLEKYIQPRVNPNSSDIGYQNRPKYNERYGISSRYASSSCRWW